jgi:hypothetical protein
MQRAVLVLASVQARQRERDRRIMFQAGRRDAFGSHNARSGARRVNHAVDWTAMQNEQLGGSARVLLNPSSSLSVMLSIDNRLRPTSDGSNVSDPLEVTAGRWPRCLSIQHRGPPGGYIMPDARAICGK